MSNASEATGPLGPRPTPEAGGGQVASADWRQHRTAGVLIALGAAAMVGLVVLINLTHTTPSASAGTASAMGGMPAGSSATAGSSGMASTTGSSTTPASKAIPTINGATLPVMATSSAMPVAMSMVPLGQANWDGMKIEARTSAPAKFELFNGTSQQLVSPTKTTSFHLMILLSDASTGVAIPYSSVWATISKAGKIVFDERLWPMISRYMGPHYGNNVSLPAAGTYHLSLLVSPPAAARHLEYKGLWLQPHRVNLTFRWVPKV